MIVPNSIKRKYESIISDIREVEDSVDPTLRNFCSRHEYPFLSRVKSVESVSEKIESGRYSDWSDIEDLYAATIVVPKLSAEDHVLSFLKRAFQVETIKRRESTSKPPDRFHFDTTRFIGTLDVPSPKEPEPHHDIKFEVQIRSAFEHAWQAATHDLTFKGDEVDWRRRRLAAQLKASVEQLDMLVLGFEDSYEFIPESQWRRTAVKKAIYETFTKGVADGLIPSESSPDSWSRFCDNFYLLLDASDNLNKYELPEKVNDILDKILSYIEESLSDDFPMSISLFQVVYAISESEGILDINEDRFTPPVTSELEDLFPELNNDKSFSLGTDD